VWGVLGWLGTNWVKARYAESSSITKRTMSELASSILLVTVLGVMTVGAGVGFVMLQGTPLTGAERDAVLAYSEAKTDNLMKSITDNDYAAFSRDLNDKMKGAVNADALANMRIKVNGKIGNYVSRQVDSVVQSGDVVTVIYNAKFENDAPVTVRVSFEKTEPHRISGLWYDSPKLRQP
jgi:hypothetical protein